MSKNLSDSENERGSLLFSQGNYEQAFLLYQNAIKADKNNIDANINLGICLVLLEKYSNAVEHFDEILGINSNSIMAKVEDIRLRNINRVPHLKLFNFLSAYICNELGLLLMANSVVDLNLIVNVFTKSLSYDNTFRYAYNNRGVARMKLLDFSMAIEDFENGLKLFADYSDCWYNKGKAMYDQLFLFLEMGRPIDNYNTKSMLECLEKAKEMGDSDADDLIKKIKSKYNVFKDNGNIIIPDEIKRRLKQFGFE